MLKSFGSEKLGIPAYWQNLETLQQLEDIDSASKDLAVLIFKHSTRCSISSNAKRRLVEGLAEPRNDLKVYYLDILACKDISNEIALRFNVQHLSPQILLIRDSKCIYDASHSEVRIGPVLEKLISKNEN